MDHKRPIKLICISGPTGAGKTAAALHLVSALSAKGIGIQIINADSRQVYRDFPVITAQPSPAERSICPHWLYGWLESEKKISAGEWAALSGEAIEKINAQQHLPIIVGGTGFYIRSLLDGIADIPRIERAISQELLDECQIKGTPAMHSVLSHIDPEYAAKIHHNDKQRIIRALEVWKGTGKTFSWWHKNAMRKSDAYDVLRLGIGLPLAELTPFLEARVDAMMASGALEEAQNALALCPDLHAPGWSGIGCMELGAYLKGSLSLQEGLSLWKANTRAYAKRQWTWFRADQRIAWQRPGQWDLLEKRVLDFLFLQQRT